jgi:hypothetical protein
MANIVTFTLNPAYSGTDADDFEIIGIHENGSPANTTIDTGVLKTDLATGVTYTIAETITGGTITAKNTTCDGTSINWSITPQTTPTPTTTNTIVEQGKCYSLTYSTIPSDLAVRWTDFEDDIVTTSLIQNLETMDNGDGTYSVYLCVKQGGAYSTPVCVSPGIGGIEITCDPYIWSTDDCPCSTNAACLIGCV